jgi:small GTP-binding protein
MLQKKICLVGAFATGKTSLISRYVYSIFSDSYHTTVGVKIDKKIVTYGEQQLNLIIWDLYGEDDFQKIKLSYLRGSSGYLLVVDGTRHSTWEKALELQQRVEDVLGKVPFVLVMNKSDLQEEWEINNLEIKRVIDDGWNVISTSAKTGYGVEEVFQTLASKILGE